MARKRKIAFKENPFIAEYVQNTNFKKVIKSATDKDGNVVTKVLGKDPTLIKHVGLFNITTKIVDTTPFLKIKANALNPYNNLSSAGLKVFGILMEECSGLEGKDKMEVVLAWEVLNEEYQANMSRTTFNRGINDLIDAKFIAPSLVNNVFFVNPAMIYNGDSVVVATQYIHKGTQTAIKYTQAKNKGPSLFPEYEELSSGRYADKETGEIIDAEYKEDENE